MVKKKDLTLGKKAHNLSAKIVGNGSGIVISGMDRIKKRESLLSSRPIESKKHDLIISSVMLSRYKLTSWPKKNSFSLLTQTFLFFTTDNSRVT